MSRRLTLLSGLRVVNLAAGMAPALVAKFLWEAGAEVIAAPPAGAEVFNDLYPAYPVWQRGHTIRSRGELSRDDALQLLAKADICLVGGEDHPSVSRDIAVADVASIHPRLLVLDLAGYPPGTAGGTGPAVEILAQARSGLAFEQFSERPMMHAYFPASYGAALQGLVGLSAALYERETSGAGQIVSTSLYEGALTFLQCFAGAAERTGPDFEFVTPRDPQPLIVKCADGAYVQLSLGSAGSKAKLYGVLGIPGFVDPLDTGYPSASDPPSKFFGDVALVSQFAAKLPSDELLQRVSWEGLVAAKVLAPGECWDNEQIKLNGLIVEDEAGLRYVGNPASVTTEPGGMALSAPIDKRPLSGLKVVDFGMFVAGPLATVVLADLGADVIKVESLQGDPNRGIFPSFSSANRGKKAISLDMKTPKGGEIAARLCASADIVTSNFRPGVADRLGIGSEALHRARPGVVVLQASGYGSIGPLADQPALDPVIQAFCGHGMRGGGVGNAPLWNRAAMVDYATGYISAATLLMALYHRQRTGEGVTIDVPLVNGGIWLLSDVIQAASGEYLGGAPVNSEQTGFHPAECMYQAADGWVAVAARDDVAAGQLAEALGLTGAVGRFGAEWGGPEHELIAAEIRMHPRSELLASLARAGVWAEACLTPDEAAVLSDPALIDAGTIHQSAHPKFGNVRVPGSLFRFSRSERGGRASAPLPGADSSDILHCIGYSDPEIEALGSRVVR